jgi:hypothetical protein
LLFRAVNITPPSLSSLSRWLWNNAAACGGSVQAAVGESMEYRQLQISIPLTNLLILSARLDRINLGGNAPAYQVHSTDNEPRGDFGLIGLAVMGQNLILNAADHGYKVIAFNRTVSKVDHFLANEAKGKPQNSLRKAPLY